MTIETMVHMRELARSFLQESVFASRQASHSFSPRALDGATGCGLGLRPAIPDDFNDKQAELLEKLLAAANVGTEGAPFSAIRDQATEWIKLQDALDRKRNHFLRDFRTQHGAERKSYSSEVEAAFKGGLQAVNDENNALLEAHAGKLAALFDNQD